MELNKGSNLRDLAQGGISQILAIEHAQSAETWQRRHHIEARLEESVTRQGDLLQVAASGDVSKTGCRQARTEADIQNSKGGKPGQGREIVVIDVGAEVALRISESQVFGVLRKGWELLCREDPSRSSLRIDDSRFRLFPPVEIRGGEGARTKQAPGDKKRVISIVHANRQLAPIPGRRQMPRRETELVAPTAVAPPPCPHMIGGTSLHAGNPQ